MLSHIFRLFNMSWTAVLPPARTRTNKSDKLNTPSENTDISRIFQ